MSKADEIRDTAIVSYSAGYDSGLKAGQRNIMMRVEPLFKKNSKVLTALVEQHNDIKEERDQLKGMLNYLAAGTGHFDVDTIVNGRIFAMRQITHAFALKWLRELADEGMQENNPAPTPEGLTGNELVYASSFLAMLGAEIAHNLAGNREHALSVLEAAFDGIDEHLISDAQYEKHNPGALDTPVAHPLVQFAEELISEAEGDSG